jgi:LysR family glycine cleavage system transcriptional activator
LRRTYHLNALRTFEAAARHLSFVTAAEELNATPAAIGQLVRGLEETLGIELFRRSQAGPTRLVLTEAARAALPDLESGFDRLSAVFQSAAVRAQPRSGFQATETPKSRSAGVIFDRVTVL